MKRTLLTLVTCILAMVLSAQQTDTLMLRIEGTLIHSVLSTPNDRVDVPLVIFIAGSGPTDLDGNQNALKNNSLKMLSESLLAQNIATLRFDKRGIAKSADPNFTESKVTIDRYVEDVRSIIGQMKNKGFKDIFIMGHSEGSLIGLIAIQKLPVKGFISLAGAGFPADQIFKTQLEPKVPAVLWPTVSSIIDSLKNDLYVRNVSQPLMVLFRPSVQPYLISWFNYSPTELISTLDCPSLIVQGDKDLQVTVTDAQNLQKASKNGKLVVIKNMNHVLKPVAGDTQDNYAAYTNPDLPIDKDLSKTVVDFILNNHN